MLLLVQVQGFQTLPNFRNLFLQEKLEVRALFVLFLEFRGGNHAGHQHSGHVVLFQVRFQSLAAEIRHFDPQQVAHFDEGGVVREKERFPELVAAGVAAVVQHVVDVHQRAGNHGVGQARQPDGGRGRRCRRRRGRVSEGDAGHAEVAVHQDGEGQRRHGRVQLLDLERDLRPDVSRFLFAQGRRRRQHLGQQLLGTVGHAVGAVDGLLVAQGSGDLVKQPGGLALDGEGNCVNLGQAGQEQLQVPAVQVPAVHQAGRVDHAQGLPVVLQQPALPETGGQRQRQDLRDVGGVAAHELLHLPHDDVGGVVLMVFSQHAHPGGGPDAVLLVPAVVVIVDDRRQNAGQRARPLSQILFGFALLTSAARRRSGWRCARGGGGHEPRFR